MIESNRVAIGGIDPKKDLPFASQQQLHGAQQQQAQAETLQTLYSQTAKQKQLQNESQEQESRKTARRLCFACQRAHLTCGKLAFSMFQSMF
jgi:hypothetical protein